MFDIVKLIDILNIVKKEAIAFKINIVDNSLVLCSLNNWDALHEYIFEFKSIKLLLNGFFF